jgi:hypothetical protein
MRISPCKTIVAIVAIGVLSTAAPVEARAQRCSTTTVAVAATSPATNVTKEYRAIDAARLASGDEIWAVGQYLRDDPTTSNSGLRDGPLAEHWDGQQMTRVDLPPVPGAASTSLAELSDVAVIDRSDVWAVGTLVGSSGSLSGLAAHWNGSTWQWTQLPNGDRLHVRAVAVAGPNDVWAVAADVAAGVTYPGNVVHVFHFDGTTWTADTTATAALSTLTGSDVQDSVSLLDIDAVRTNGMTRLMVVGWWHDYSAGHRRTVALSRDGLQWTASAPGDTYEWSHLGAVSFSSGGDAWAVGGTEARSSTSTVRPITLRWHDGSWSTVTTPSSASNIVLNDVDAHLSTAAWQGGGTTTDPTKATSTIEQWNGTTWSSVSSSTGATIDHLSAVASDQVWLLSDNLVHRLSRTCR